MGRNIAYACRHLPARAAAMTRSPRSRATGLRSTRDGEHEPAHQVGACGCNLERDDAAGRGPDQVDGWPKPFDRGDDVVGHLAEGRANRIRAATNPVDRIAIEQRLPARQRHRSSLARRVSLVERQSGKADQVLGPSPNRIAGNPRPTNRSTPSIPAASAWRNMIARSSAPSCGTNRPFRLGATRPFRAHGSACTDDDVPLASRPRGGQEVQP